MSLFDSASLVVTPNGVKAGKLYSIKPTDASGDLSVTRATSATRVNANGLVEIPRTNLVLQSQTFDNASWTKPNTIITANNTTAPDGTSTADLFSGNGATSVKDIIQTLTTSLSAGKIYTTSFYAKKNTNNFIQIIGSTSIYSSNTFANFDLNNGVVGSFGGAVISSNIISVGNGWYRCSMTATCSITSSTNIFILALISSATSVRAESNTLSTSVYLWGAQLNEGNVATEYIPTTSSIRTKFAGITQDGSSASNIPRLDYTNGSCPSILVEPQRTNINLRSEEFDNATWTKFNTTVTSNQITSPDGTSSADKILDTSVNNVHLIGQNLSATSGSTYTYSVFAKKGEIDVLQFSPSTGYLNAAYVNFDLTNGVISATGGLITSSIIDYGNGWFRCIATFTANFTSTATFSLILQKSSTALRGASYLGNGTDGLYLWGAQLEVGSNATSYIPTTSATVTRNADVISKTGISSLIGQTEGTILFDADVTNTTGLQIGTTDGGSDYVNSIQIAFGSSSTNVNVFNGGTPQFSYAGAISTGRKKVAIAYKANDFALYINGVQIATDTSGTVPTLSGLFFNHQNLSTTNGKINLTALWKTRLTNAELATLTTI